MTINKILRNKKADEKLISMWMILIWFIVGISIVIGVIMASSQLFDSRVSDATALNSFISTCLAKDNNFVLLKTNSLDLSTICNLNQEVINKNLHYVNVTLLDSSNNDVYSKLLGNAVFQNQCDYQISNKLFEKNFAQCKYTELNLIDKSGNSYVIKILSASNQK